MERFTAIIVREVEKCVKGEMSDVVRDHFNGVKILKDS